MLPKTLQNVTVQKSRRSSFEQGYELHNRRIVVRLPARAQAVPCYRAYRKAVGPTQRPGFVLREEDEDDH